MAKRRKLQRQTTKAQQKPKPNLHPTSQDNQKKKQPQSKKRQYQQRQRQERPVIPFNPEDRILLIGEADLSFAASLVKHHGCANVTATVLEKDHAELVAKYPLVDDNIGMVLGTKEEEPAPESEDPGATTLPGVEDEADHENDTDDIGDTDDDDDDDGSENDIALTLSKRRKSKLPLNNKLLYNIDATKLPNSVTRPPHNHVIFNFPHVGGKSTDVNRQVRYNQELLVSFFASALKALAPGGSIVVTLFEGEPYTLWNIRDLGRHAGLQVEKSFRFQAAAYPGYRHARTLGVVKNKKGETGGGWKGEDRLSRSYVFRRKGEVPEAKSKRKRDDDSSDEDD